MASSSFVGLTTHGSEGHWEVRVAHRKVTLCVRFANAAPLRLHELHCYGVLVGELVARHCLQTRRSRIVAREGRKQIRLLQVWIDLLRHFHLALHSTRRELHRPDHPRIYQASLQKAHGHRPTIAKLLRPSPLKRLSNHWGNAEEVLASLDALLIHRVFFEDLLQHVFDLVGCLDLV